jgi:small subunit ribosomal protein S7
MINRLVTRPLRTTFLLKAARSNFHSTSYVFQDGQKSLLDQSASLLTGIGELRSQKPLSKEEADKEAEEWIKAMQELRQEFLQDGEFHASKVFAPTGSEDEFNIVKQATALRDAQKFVPSEEQKLQHMKLKDLPIPSKRDETVNFLANVIMRHGRKARAQKSLSRALYLVHLKTRQDPVAQLKEVLEKMSPLVKLVRYTDGGARAELIPLPLTERQRLRQAWTWILEASDKRPSKDFSVRLSEEILSAIQGKSPGFEKKVNQHKLATVNRAFVKLMQKRRR